MAEILIAEDSDNIRDGIKCLLEGDFYAVHAARNGTDALALYRRYHPTLVILDVMMPKMDGLDVLKAIREIDTDTPVLLLTARAQEQDKIIGFGLGCDDYLTKPFSPREFLARTAALVRRSPAFKRAEALKEEEREFDFCGGKVVPLDRAFITGENKFIHLCESEIRLMRLFAQNANRTIRKQTLLQAVWCGYTIFSRTLDTHIANIRRKLGPSGKAIRSIYGIGYKYQLAR